MGLRMKLEGVTLIYFASSNNFGSLNAFVRHVVDPVGRGVDILRQNIRLNSFQELTCHCVPIFKQHCCISLMYPQGSKRFTTYETKAMVRVSSSAW